MFRTELPLTPHPQQLPHSARVLTIGSCFSDSIGNRLADFKVATLVNPFGTVFNPVSACKLLRAAAGEDMDWQQHLVEARGRWQSYDLHATLGAESPVDLLQRIQELVRDTGVFLATADAVVLTLGTAYSYRLKETGEIISNCHKVPADKFEKELLTADEMIAAIAETHAYLRRINPRLRIILTVSPVRHLKETLPLSSVSKSMLRVACHYLSELLPDVSYFPAYELLLDDLRDYRFYASDMLHPSDVAENYIWERFTRTYFDAAFGRFKKEWESIRQALAHRPLHVATPEHRQFLEATLARLQRLSAQADLRMELLHVEREIAALPLPPPPAPEPEEEDEEDFLEEEELQDEDEDHARAELLGSGSGLLIEAEEEEPESAEADPEDAYETAYSGEKLEYTAEDEQADAAADSSVGGEPARKKKRRSRGGAKRSKRKAARLAAEAEAAAAVTAVEPLLGQSDDTVVAEPEAVKEAISPSEEITYISEEELFGRSNRPSAPEAPDAVAQEELLLKTETADEEASDTAEPTERNSRRRNRPQRKGRQQDREPRRGNRAALYAVPPADETPEHTDATPATTDAAPTPVAEASAPPASDQSAPEKVAASTQVQNRSRNRGGAGRNRGGAAQSRIAAAAEAAATVAPQSVAPTANDLVEAVVSNVPALAEAAPETAAAKPRPKRTPRKAAASAPEIAIPVVAVVAPEPAAPAAAPAPKKRAARKAPPTPTPETGTAVPVSTSAAPASKASRSRKKPAPAPEVGLSAEEGKAPKKPRPPRRKPTADQSAVTPE